MKWWLLSSFGMGSLMLMPTFGVRAEPGFQVVYPPTEHTTAAPQIFFIGTAPPQVPVQINGVVVGDRSAAGHFAPSIPLQPGVNRITLRAGDQTREFTITRTTPAVPQTLKPLEPTVDWVRLPKDNVCFTAAAPPNRLVQVRLGTERLTLQPLPAQIQLPSNLAALIDQSAVTSAAPPLYRNCLQLTNQGDYGSIQWQMEGEAAPLRGARIQVADPAQLPVIEVTRTLGGVARTGPSSDYSRLTPLPVGTRDRVQRQTGDWLQLEYGGWIRANEVKFLPSALPTTATIRSITSRQRSGWTEVIFPLDVPVPIAIQQGDRHLTLTLYNTIPQTDIIRLDADPVIQRLDWQPLTPQQVQYRFNLHHRQQWGYRVAYDQNRLILQLRHPPQLQRGSLRGITILLDPGHGGPEDLGARGPDGTPEKTVTLALAQKLTPELEALGATVVLTRTEDIDLDLPERILAIEAAEPTLALSLHYNALPDAGDARNTQGIGTFWYHPQSHDLAVFLEGYLSRELGRQQYGVFWNNLALTRPTVAPAVLLELGFMIHPEEFEWIVNPQAQQQLARTLARGIRHWLEQAAAPHSVSNR